MTASAIKSGYPLAEIVELRKLETQEIVRQSRERYDSLTGDMTGWIDDIRTQNFTVNDWMGRYNDMSVSLAALDHDSKTYQDDSIGILTDQFDILKKIYDIQSQQLSALTNTSDSLVSQIWDLQHSDFMPVSVTDYQDQYAQLLATAWTPNANGYLDTDAIGLFQNFVGDYLDVLGGLGYDYNNLVGTAIGDLGDLRSAVMSESEMLTMALGQNTEAVDANTNAILAQLQDLIDTTQGIANREVYDAWIGAAPPAQNLSGAVSFLQPDNTPDYLGGQWQRYASSSFGNYLTSGPGVAYSQIAAQSQMIIDWANNIDTSISPEIAAWVESINSIGFKQLTFDDVDINQDGYYTAGEFFYAAQGVIDQYNKLLEYLADIPSFATGGLGTIPSIFAEAGPEWAVPAYGSSYNENFLKSVGMDRVIGSMSIDYDKLGQAMAKYLVPAILSAGSNPINVNITDEVLARSTQRQVKSNGDLVRTMRRALLNP